ncbi:MAG: dehypoxanthine futalosine cyclase, partial [Selenomonas massiliensis]
AGTRYNRSIKTMIDLIRGAGRMPAQRDTRYRVIRRF